MSKENLGFSTGIDVGYVDEAESWKLESRFFPSKVGGRPAWLNLTELPSPEEMKCMKCHEACIFLCQVYAPIETRDDCFHRSLFVFLCRNPKCCTSNDNSMFIVYRSQLQRQNDFYPSEPPEDSKEWNLECRPEKWSDLCAACGIKGTSHCGKCKKVKYCGRSHQIIHWKEHHKGTCNPDGENDLSIKSSCLLPELELIVEPEGDIESICNDKHSDEESDDDSDAEQTQIQEFQRLAQEGKIGTLAGDESVITDLLNIPESTEDKAFCAFKARISQNPGQVLRYERGGVPLWLSDNHIPAEADVPPCQYCGSKRIFEFQILPQILNHLSLDNVDQSIDWGILIVYTCERSCNEGPAYKKEFLWKQDLAV